ncbi:MAG: hypothetical protein JSW50_09980 [Candidatus Latescibacterota bacterium]|nr:MAG: hypothetical protein JSW50_09980 [Candidatus Latescibacterota bacterium]
MKPFAIWFIGRRVGVREPACALALVLTVIFNVAAVTPAWPMAPPALTPAPPDSSGLVSGTGSSYWGMIPAPMDSSTAVFDNRGRKAWEWPLAVPYSAINLVLRGIRVGTAVGVLWVKDWGVWRYVSILPIPQGFTPGVDYSALEGFGLTVSYQNRLGSPNNPFRLRGYYSMEGWQKYTLGFMFNQNGKTNLQVGFGYRLRPKLSFCGIGPNSRGDHESFYEDERAWGGANLRYWIAENTFISFLGAFSSIAARDPDTSADTTTIADIPGGTPPGFEERSDGVMLRFASVYNTAKNLGNPDRGTILGGTIGGFVSTNSADAEFLAYRLEFQKFFPLWHHRRVLAVRAYMNWIDELGDTTVPFQRMFINEMPDQFRGFDESRWRDLGITGITLEYRFPLMAIKPNSGFGIDTIFLADIGQVFDDLDQIKRDNLTQSYGFGFRTYITPNFLGTMEFVWSDEGFQFRLSTRQLFQFSKDVLYQGREETIIH